LYNQIYISSLAFEGKSINEIYRLAKKNSWAIEFTSTFNYSENLLDDVLKLDIIKTFHNYFPPHKDEFVLNLASTNEVIRKKSIEHCINGLILSNKINSTFYAAHAGFCIDPNFSELGKKLDFNKNINRELCKSIFLESVNLVLKVADRLGMMFLIENNVISKQNMMNGINPLLCCDSCEINWLIGEINNENFGILLDTAHLKVSCNTLNKNIETELDNIETSVKALHHSDNEGFKDNNMSISNSYWFLKHLNKFKNIPHTIEVKNLTEFQVNEQINILNKK
jgi:endonuclease IV